MVRINTRKEFENGTYELIGPKINNNPERVEGHWLIRHGDDFAGFGLELKFPRTFDEIKQVMKTFPYEGVVWHHPDGRMVNIKKKDFNFTEADRFFEIIGNTEDIKQRTEGAFYLLFRFGFIYLFQTTICFF